MRHLWRCEDAVWCNSDMFVPQGAANDPYDADCASCLREAAEYGAKAAMRCAAVENGAQSDAELQQELDEALKQLDSLRGTLGQHGLFACAGCARLFVLSLSAFHVGAMRWCADCAAARGRIL